MACLLLPLLVLLFSNGGGAGAIPLGSVLTPLGSNSSSSSSWSSPNGTFSVRFVPSPSHPSLFLASIVFSGGLPVWSAGGASAAVDSSASLSLLPDGDLRLLNGSGAIVWRSNTSSLDVSSAALLESGNLVLQSASNSAVWQSFENPTDTLVQSQNFTSAASLVSGLYSFSLLRSSGNLTLRWNGTVVYLNEGYNASFTANRTLTPLQDCRPRTPLQDCRANWTMLQLENTRFLTYPPDIATEQFFIGITACRQNCLSGQSCVASTALADGSGFCYIVIDFVSGYHSAALPSTSYVKVCAPDEPNPPPGALAAAQPGV